MMRILTTAYYEFLKNLRDIKMFAILVVFPIVMIYLLGNAIGTYFSEDVDKKIPIGYVNQDKDIISQEFDKFLDIKEIKDRLAMSAYNDEKQGQDAIADGKIDVLIYLPKDFSQNLIKGNKQTVYLYGEKNLVFVENLVNSFISRYNVATAVKSVNGKPVQPTTANVLKRVFYTKDAAVPDAMDYYAVLTLLQMLFMGAMLGIFITSRTSGSDIHIRLDSLPVAQWKLILGKILGSTVYMMMASIITILFTKYVYHSNWNGNMLIILGALLLFSLISIGMGIIIGIIIPGFATGLMIVMLLMMFFATASGGIMPSSSMDFLSFISPNFHAKNILFGTIYGYSKQVIIEALLWLVGMLAVTFGAGALLLRRVGYDNI
jgi:ABC-2 type transport system permease protein